MLARNTCWLEPRACTPTLLPLRSAIVRMRSLANSSKQPGCTPASIVIGLARVHRDEQRRDEVGAEVDLAARDLARLLGPGLGRHVADVGEALGAQQVLGEVLRRDADARDLAQADRGRLRRRLVGERAAAAKHARGAGGRQPGEEIGGDSV